MNKIYCSLFNLLFLILFTMWFINELIQTPVTTPIVNDNITRNPGVTAKNTNIEIIKHISTAKNDAIIIILLSFII
jgi:hypothetical protein